MAVDPQFQMLAPVLQARLERRTFAALAERGFEPMFVLDRAADVRSLRLCALASAVEEARLAEKTVAEKLLIKPGYRVLLLNAPEGYASLLGALPEGATLVRETSGAADLVQLFVRSRAELEASLAGAQRSLAPKGLLWVTYPKGTSAMRADINRDSINSYAAGIGLQGVAMIAVDDTWSALRLKAM